MKITSTHNRVMAIGLLMLNTSVCFAQKMEACFNMPFTPIKGQVVAKGISDKHDVSVRNAHIDLQRQIATTEVEDQFIKSHKASTVNNQTEQKINYEVNSYLTSKSKRANGIVKQQTVKCKGSFVTSILYDNRSLSLRVNQVLANKNIRLVGGNYLIKSDLLSRFHNPQAKNKLAVNIAATPEGNFLLFLGQETLNVNKNQLDEVITLPLKHNSLGDVSIRVSENSLITRGVINISISANKKTKTRLYLCNQQGQCNTLHSHIIGSQSFNLLNTATSSNIKAQRGQTAYLIAINEQVISHSKLALSNNRSELDFYFQLLKQLESSPKQSDWQSIKVARNF